MSVWEFLIILAVALPILVLWLSCIVDAIARPDLGGGKKALWAVGIIVFPVAGAIAYILMRPRHFETPATDAAPAWESADSISTSPRRSGDMGLDLPP